MRKLNYLTLSIFLLLGSIIQTGCETTRYEEQQTPQLTSDVARLNSAYDSGRVDVIGNVAHSMQAYIKTPTKPVNVSSIKNYVVLPEIYRGKEYILYNDLMQQKDVVTQLQKDEQVNQQELSNAQSQLVKDKQVQDGLIKQNQQYVDQINHWKASWFYKAYVFYHSLWTLWIIIPVIAAGLIALCVFAPPAVPIATSILSEFFSLLGTFIGWIIQLALKVIRSMFSVASTTSTTPVTTTTTPATK
jgi:hypothetical protein